MRSWKPIAGALLVFAGFCAGVGLNFKTVHGAPDDRNRELNSVDHDSTLVGDGTRRAPLGIANGGVSARKLSTATAPSQGQILGFNGANLAWQNGVLGARVVDSLGHDIGPFVDDVGTQSRSSVIRTIEGFAFLLPVNAAGFFPSSTSAQVYFPTSDCSGPGYLYIDQTILVERPADGLNTAEFGTTIVFGAAPGQQMMLQSSSTATSLPVSQKGCRSVGFTALVGPLTSLDLTTLGFTPPFHLEF